MLVLATTRIGKYYRATVSIEVRKILGIEENNVTEWILEGIRVVVKKGGTHG